MKELPLCGQWIGKFYSTFPSPESPDSVFPGNATFNIECDRPNFGFACIDQGNQIHGSRKDFSIKIEGSRITGRAISTCAFDYDENQMIDVEESVQRLKDKIPNVFYLTDLVIENGTIDQNAIICEWSGIHQGKKIKGKFSGQKLRLDKSSPPNESMSWDKFKSFITKQIQNGREFFFRGQASNKHGLNTTFHREYRFDLLRYDREACQKLTQLVNAISPHQYDKNKEFGPLLSLAQHHGFPTPLLDWSKSPYIAAFFALESRPIDIAEDDNPRIYIFDSKAWRQNTTQVSHIADPRPTITPLEFPAYNNPRHLPQQSVHTYTNIEDPEAWIRLVEKEKNKSYLTVIDIPRSEREFAMRDLAYMGVTAAALFPGLDGICRSLKEEFFPPRNFT